MNTAQTKTITRHLQDALVLEGTLRRTLIAHIAISPRDRHRELLEQHLRVTIGQERRLAGRLGELSPAAGPAQAAVGAAKGAAALGLTLVKGPLDVLRGTDGDTLAIRNVQDESASEALEIAVYETLEALAERLGDPKTAALARAHREQEQAFLDELRTLIPALAGNVAERTQGRRRFPLSTLGVVDAARVLVSGAQAALVRDDGDVAPPAGPGTPPSATAAPAAPAPKPKPKTAATAPTAKPAAPQAKKQAPPIAEYDDMSPAEIEGLLDHLPADRLDAVEAYERAGEARDQVLDAIGRQREVEAGARR